MSVRKGQMGNRSRRIEEREGWTETDWEGGERRTETDWEGGERTDRQTGREERGGQGFGLQGTALVHSPLQKHVHYSSRALAQAENCSISHPLIRSFTVTHTGRQTL